MDPAFCRQKLAALKSEMQRGARELEALERRRRDLRSGLLRLSGAVSLLEELLAAEASVPFQGRAAAG